MLQHLSHLFCYRSRWTSIKFVAARIEALLAKRRDVEALTVFELVMYDALSRRESRRLAMVL